MSHSGLHTLGIIVTNSGHQNKTLNSVLSIHLGKRETRNKGFWESRT